MHRLKVELLSDVEPVLHGWDKRFVVPGDAFLPSMRGVPEDLRYCFIPSGEVMAPLPYESPRLGSTERIGGGYLYRVDVNDPKPLNRDDYHFVRSRRDPELVWVDGPFRHPKEHWADFEDVEKVLSFTIL